MPEALELSCHRCATGHRVEGPLSRGALCNGCGVELRCCLNCRFYDPRAYNECGEPAAERVVEKAEVNFCDHFKAGRSASGSRPTRASDAAGDLEALFKK